MPVVGLAVIGALAWTAWTERHARDAGLEAAAESAERATERHETEPGPFPSDWFLTQRAYPTGSIPHEKLAAAVQQVQLERVLERAKPDAAAGTLVWENAGPFNIGGRVTALAVAPGAQTVYIASANGGVFKSTNAGVNWTPVFDEHAVYSIGALALQPGSSNVLYVGTGEANGSVDSYDGAGLFRTADGGTSWQFLGLESTRRIARIAVDPSNTSRIFVAAMGAQFSTDPERGLYRSEDAGASWQKMLFVNDSTGVCDVVINPNHPDTVYAATWERVRRSTYRRAFGPGCGIWRSADGGDTWTRLQNGLPAPSDNVGRIGLALAPSRPAWVYAQIIGGSAQGYQGLGLYRSTDGGNNWTRRDIGTSFTGMFGGFGWYFGDMAVDPVDRNIVYALGVTLRRSTNSGQSFVNIMGNPPNNAHVDMHALWIDPTNTQHIYLGCDGGFYSTTNGGGSWFKSVDLPITQFYAGTIDPQNPNRLLGGTQDNNTLLTAGPPNEWDPILGGDGFQCIVDPLDSNILFAEWQYCCSGTGLQRSADGGSSFIPPTGFDSADRYNWNTPIVMHPNNHNIILVGSHRVYRSTDNGENYFPISEDLTSNPGASLVFGTITTLDISRVISSLYYAGTDDGRVWRTSNSGTDWTRIDTGLPVRWVTRVTADPFDDQAVYVTLSGFQRDETDAHVYYSTNRGDTWTSIAGNLPDVPANDIVVDAADPYTLYLATDVGVYATRNRGVTWFPLGTGMPVQTVFDLTLHPQSGTLVAATHGRGQWRIDLLGLPSDVVTGPDVRVQLGAPVPNPSRAEARFELALAADAARAEVAVYDVGGRVVRELRRGALRRGTYSLVWDGRDTRGVQVAAGVYFVRARVDGAVRLQRIVRSA
jgi:photosystem II stability/assembly factor-like uncharacterized protein